MRLVSPAVRVEPGLLRAVRRLLPRDRADAGTEADVWNDPAVNGGNAVAMGFADSEVRRAYRHGFTREVELQDGVALALARWHDALDDVLRAEESVTLAELGRWSDRGERPALVMPNALAKAYESLRRMQATLAEDDAAGSRARMASVVAYVERLVQRVPEPCFDEHCPVGDALVRIWHHVHGDDPDALPPGVTPERLARLVGTPGPTRPFTVRQEGGELVVAHGSPTWPVVRGERGSPLTTLMAARGELAVGSSSSWTPVLSLDVAPARCSLPPRATLHVRTDRSARVFAPLVKPSWASAVGRDAYGLWATLEVGEAQQRFRWIPPGRFLMGSPEREQGRYDQEGPQHEVTITRGFWLGDTPCTQTMWQAITGENPSRFKSPGRPVEQVSWDDANALLDRLNAAHTRDSDGQFRLPSEAEWEYACRAGTTTSTYAGEPGISGTRNAPLLDRIAWYGGNSGVDFDLDDGIDSSDWPEKQYEHTRAGTREVAQKAPNIWGLFDMLGNVWEWCADDWLPPAYSRRRTAEDPVVAPNGGNRVNRGGSWSDFAVDARAACRDGDHRGNSNGHLGFRLARGQELRTRRLPTHTSIVLAHVRQWGHILKACAEDERDLLFLVHASREQNLELFMQRIRDFLEEECSRRHRVLTVERHADHTRARTQEDWERQFIRATRAGTRPLGFAIQRDAKRGALLFLVEDRGGPLRDLDEPAVRGLYQFLRDRLSGALATSGKSKPVRVVIPIERSDERSRLHEKLLTLLASVGRRGPLHVEPPLELHFPSQEDVEEHINADDVFRNIDGLTRERCLTVYREVAASPGRSLQELGDRLHEILFKWESDRL